MRKIINRAANIVKFLVGAPKEFTIEARIFHCYLLLSFLFIFLIWLVNIALGLYIPASLTIVYLIYETVIFYLSRFKGVVTIIASVNAVITTVLLAVNYFINNGVSGPTFLLNIVFFLLLAAYVPKKHFVWLGIFNVSIIVVVQYLELSHPSLVPDHYASSADHHLDILLTYIICAACGFFTINYLKYNYDREHHEATRKAEQLSLSNTEKDKLFSIVSHDLRTPLAHLTYYLELLGQAPFDKQTHKEMQLELVSATRNTQELLTNLLLWSKKQFTGANQINLKILNVSKLVVEATKLIESIASVKQIKIGLKIPSAISIIADKDLFQVVMRNILHNAVKFTPEGGEINISGRMGKRECIIEVKDTGLGMDEDKKAQLFSFQVESTYGTESEKGVGLGLYLSKEFMLQQGGRIWVDSKPKYGSTFYLAFPIV